MCIYITYIYTYTCIIYNTCTCGARLVHDVVHQAFDGGHVVDEDRRHALEDAYERQVACQDLQVHLFLVQPQEGIDAVGGSQPDDEGQDVVGVYGVVGVGDRDREEAPHGEGAGKQGREEGRLGKGHRAAPDTVEDKGDHAEDSHDVLGVDGFRQEREREREQEETGRQNQQAPT